MPTTVSQLATALPELLGERIVALHRERDELSAVLKTADIVSACETLRDAPMTRFDQLIDLCGMDYAEYGQADYDPAEQIGAASADNADAAAGWPGSRYAVVYHLLSLEHNVRLRLRVDLDAVEARVDSVISVWPAADWYEREAFDLFGIVFNNHPDLRRLLTDYGFIGHPFRKDFPLSGQVEMRYDEQQKRVIYEPVSIEPRVLVPRSIRKDVFANAASAAVDADAPPAAERS